MIAKENNGPPDYLPARMLNEFVYCPRLFYYEHVDGVFADNRETVEGSLRHARVDEKEDPLPSAEELAASGDAIHSRSVTLSSEKHRLIAKMDLIEGDGNTVTPVDYKRGAPKESASGLTAWDTDRVQLAVQAMVLREHGYHCDEGVIYYVATKQRVRIAIDEALEQFVIQSMAKARETAASGFIPPPLVDSPKCPRCSLVGICLPDETMRCERWTRTQNQRLLFDIGFSPAAETAPEGEPTQGPRRLVPARDDLRPLYLNTQGLYVGKNGNVLRVKEKEKVVQEVRIFDICQLSLFGNIQLSTQAIQSLCENEIPIAYFSQGGWFYGVTHGLGIKNIFLRREQFRWADSPTFCLRFARALVAGKIKNQRTMLQRNHIEPPVGAIAQMKYLVGDVEHAESLEQLLGLEGNAARIYFENFAGMIKANDDLADDRPKQQSLFATSPVQKPTGLLQRFDFVNRNRRPPRDPVNALLSLGYSLLAKDLAIVCQSVGFDPYLGFYHQPRFGRASLALDLLEPFRPLIADSAVLTAINTRMVTEDDFIAAGQSVALTANGRKAFFRAYEQRMDTLVTHPLFGYRVSYRRMLEIQTRLLARVVTGEIPTYPVFVTR